MALPSATTPFLRLRVEVAQPDDLSNQTSDPSTLPFRPDRDALYGLFSASLPTEPVSSDDSNAWQGISSANSCHSGITPKGLGTTGYAATFRKDTPSMFEISVARHLFIMRW